MYVEEARIISVAKETMWGFDSVKLIVEYVDSYKTASPRRKRILR